MRVRTAGAEGDAARGGETALEVEGGLLCQLLRSPDYNLFPRSAVFESNFIQVTKQGNWVDIHNCPTAVTLGVTSSDPCLPLPNVLLMARWEDAPQGPLEETPVALSRLLPLRYVRLSVQDATRRLLRLQVATGPVYYLCLRPEHPDAVFRLWGRLAAILRHGLSITCKDPAVHLSHSLVPSPAGSSSSSEPAPELQTPAGARLGRRLSRLSRMALGRAAEDSLVWRRLSSFWTLATEAKPPARDEAPGAPGPPGGKLMVCERCLGQLLEPDPSYAGEEAKPKGETTRHGLWERETPSGLLPLSRLSSLIAVGQR
ncbi:PREDICTED: protein FAM71F2-like [Gavialis gangeticus]|uniref:protein FAM71F2-like n=1 Tax=Gavialis gangeticus TaxID=94835 RepID=UPI00092EF3C7|nr:PREDICTED: protein FAM71F2-like [Gavialis gangeticus]